MTRPRFQVSGVLSARHHQRAEVQWSLVYIYIYILFALKSMPTIQVYLLALFYTSTVFFYSIFVVVVVVVVVCLFVCLFVAMCVVVILQTQPSYHI